MAENVTLARSTGSWSGSDDDGFNDAFYILSVRWRASCRSCSCSGGRRTRRNGRDIEGHGDGPMTTPPGAGRSSPPHPASSPEGVQPDTTAEIARERGSRGTLYHHFGSKDGFSYPVRRNDGGVPRRDRGASRAGNADARPSRPSPGSISTTSPCARSSTSSAARLPGPPDVEHFARRPTAGKLDRITELSPGSSRGKADGTLISPSPSAKRRRCCADVLRHHRLKMLDLIQPFPRLAG